MVSDREKKKKRERERERDRDRVTKGEREGEGGTYRSKMTFELLQAVWQLETH